ncbi:MAG: transcription-repair coupling factor [Candidatus Acidiferrales bacterium]
MILPQVAELLSRVGRHAAVEASLDAVRRGVREVRFTGLNDTAKALYAAHLASALERPVVLVTDSTRRAEALAAPLRYFHRALTGKPDASVAILPALDVLPHQERSPHAEISEARAAALWRFAGGQATVLIAPIAAAAMRLHEAEFYRQLAVRIERGADVALDHVTAQLAAIGYERHELVEMPGQFSVRGGILDVYPVEAARPVRAELFGDTVESLREFDPATQRSVQPVERATIAPLTELPRSAELLRRAYAEAKGEGHDEDELRWAGAFPGWEFVAWRLTQPLHTVLDLAARPVVLLEEPSALDEGLRALWTKLRAADHDGESESATSPDAGAHAYFQTADEWRASIARHSRVELEQLGLDRDGDTQPSAVARGAASSAPTFALVTQPTTRYHGNVAAFMAEVRGRVKELEQTLVAAASTGELERLADLCHEYEIPYQLGERDASATLARLADDASAGSVPAVTLVKAPLAQGVVFPELRITLYGNGDLFETLPAPERLRRRPKTAAFSSDLSDLHSGDYVVHVDHGIGQFEGLRQLETDGAPGEFMLLRYADDARLYLPLARVDLVQKYRTLGDAAPSLDKLGGTAWETRKKRVKKSVADMAEKLLRLYAERKTVTGHAFAGDVPWQREFEDSFDFEETADQLRAIEDTKRDMEKATPMDRLLCGDVGYGKTEVAMRAAFKVVCESKQVAVLAPTTVLVFQHYETFRRRFAAFPVRIEMLSRFRSTREQKDVLAALEAGKVDVVIGTHRLLSKDVRFQDLGLLVVDEEQRFGVAHKERIKEMRRNVDVLTMTATPIPRTLHMSLVGLRDMSVIETPPKDRLAIQTVVAPFSEKLVQQAIETELGRDGQVYFVHNRVASIYSMAALMQRLAPSARIVVGHGQMNEKELERAMMQFVRGEADVLVSTTIIENGLDIPRCNTIFINRADRYGLSELYQLRGRVGRSNLHAYAYLLVPQDAPLSALARRRLAALKEFTELGAGFRIAALDLELRGAGNMLGAQQHGHINAIGFDLYCQMMERAVAELKGEAPRMPELRVTLNLGLDIRIPPDYIPSENLRLRTYKRIAGVATAGERDEVMRELADRFGPPPVAVGNLLDYAVLKAECEKLQVASVDRRGAQLAMKFHPETAVQPDRLVGLVRRNEGMKLDPGGTLWFARNKKQAGVTEAVRNVLLQLQA